MGLGYNYFLSIAKGSAGEVRSQLYVALDVCLIINEEQFKKLLTLTEGVSRMIYGLILICTNTSKANTFNDY